ncbi:LCP family protein [Isachenkonia alkalipeptolytica]|uniref:LytR family transcriptional regulator n=1 Tax=Isachenkonia alkalipeptolytica TaxID=2565777 RepID=A0AA43XM44_9CLOT|nr:LCP family protein [Isachenkonia alkalipeptolytica]NBG88896.1 LytR family transcriptional regulator [Isachenkonia alkalipeptolytica]
MRLLNKLKTIDKRKKILLVFVLALLIPLAVYGITTGVRMYRVYQNVHDPLEEEEIGEGEDPKDEDFREDYIEDPLPEDQDMDEGDYNEEDIDETDTAGDQESEEHKPTDDFPGGDRVHEDLDLISITGENIWDFQEIDRPLYHSSGSRKNPKHLNILLLGLDEAIDEPGRSDAIMVARLNTETEEAAILSIPRDTYVHIPSQGYSKAGHATAYGGTSLAMDTVENFLNISIDHYIRVDMAGFEHSVDALGGVTMDIPERLVQKDGKVLFEEGTTHLDGEAALEYTRARQLKEGSGGDLGRIQRQQQVLFEMLRTIRSELSMEEALTFMEQIAPYIRTDIGPGLIMDHWGAFNDLDFSAMDLRTLPGSGFFHEDIYYYRVPVENARIVIEDMAP